MNIIKILRKSNESSPCSYFWLSSFCWWITFYIWKRFKTDMHFNFAEIFGKLAQPHAWKKSENPLSLISEKTTCHYQLSVLSVHLYTAVLILLSKTSSVNRTSQFLGLFRRRRTLIAACCQLRFCLAERAVGKRRALTENPPLWTTSCENALFCSRIIYKNSASADGGLAPGSAHAGPSARTRIGTSGIFPVHVSEE